MNLEELNSWKERAISEGYKIILIIYDFEDREYYPLFFNLEKEVEKYSKNIISESKCKIVQKIILS